MDDILNKLNDSQRNAVVYNDGPSLVIAGAGSGKTRVLTYKIAYLLNQGYLPNNILAITFTNKAANEMKSRIADIVGEQTARHLWMGTFHSIFARILRIEAAAVGFSSNFTIYDTADAKSKIKDIVKELGLNDKYYTHKVLLSRISKMKNSLVTPNSYEKRYDLQEFDRLQNIPRFKEIYRIYMNQCHRANAMDFDDLLLYTNVLFRDNAEILKKYQDIFKFILVDEYQDTNFAQHLIVTKLAEQHHKLCVVGDDAQSIYSFRGANIDNILKFKDVYPEYRLFKLEQNYRSTQSIVNAANSLIAKNKGQIRKNVFSKNPVGSKIKVLSAMSDDEESEKIGNIIRKDLKDYPYQDTAVLYRTRAQSRKIENDLLRNHIPYRIYGGMSFYDLKVVKDIFAYLRLISNPNDEEAFKRAIKYPKKGIGDTTLQKIKDEAIQKDISLWMVIADPLGFKLDVSAATIKKLANFREKIQELSNLAATTNAYDLTERIIREFGIMEDLSQDSSPEGKENQRVADEVLNSIHEFCEEADDSEQKDIDHYLQSVALLTDMDRKTTDSDECTTLMTVHSAKGLEFKNVIIAGLEEDLFPLGANYDSEANIEEERRLFYVAITRTEQNCFITYAKTRFRNGKTVFSSPSRFLTDIDASLIDLPRDFHQKNESVNVDFDFYRFRNRPNTSFNNSDKHVFFKSNQETDSRQESKTTTRITSSMKKIEIKTGDEQASTENRSGLEIGMRVSHTRFGKGIIAQIEKMGDDYKLTINFENEGEKKILKKYANLTIL